MTDPDRGLRCPKCAGEMTTYERNGVTVDQCSDCRGVFLDRGELDRLIDAESRVYGGLPEGPIGWQQGGHHGGGYRRREEHGGRPQPRRRGFLSELFD